MTRCWIKAAGAGWSAGPFTAADLRNLRAAGLLPPDALVSLDAYGGFRRWADWPELVATLDSPDARTIPGATSSAPGPHVPAAGEVSSEAGDIDGDIRRFRMTQAVFDDVNAGDITPRFSSLDTLALNRAAEPDRPAVFPPWYRTPWVRNAARFLPLLAAGVWLLRLGVREVSGSPMDGVPLLAAAGAVLGGGAWYVFVLHPSRWED